MASVASVAGATSLPLLEWQVGWKPFDGKHVKYNATSKQLSCYSLDGTVCSEESPLKERAKYPVELACRPVRVGASGPDPEWCENAYAATFATWFNYKALGFKVRLSTSLGGHTMCESYDGKACEWDTQGDKPSDPAELRPLICGKQHRPKWEGTTGYDGESHWCNTPEIFANVDGPTLPESSPDYRYSNRVKRLTVPSWKKEDEPYFIVQTDPSKFGHASIVFHVLGGGWAELAQGMTQSSLTEHFIGSGAYVHLTEPREAKPGPMTLAIKLDKDGTVSYYAASGHDANIFSAQNEVHPRRNPITQLFPTADQTVEIFFGYHVKVFAVRKRARPPMDSGS